MLEAIFCYLFHGRHRIIMWGSYVPGGRVRTTYCSRCQVTRNPEVVTQ